VRAEGAAGRRGAVRLARVHRPPPRSLVLVLAVLLTACAPAASAPAPGAEPPAASASPPPAPESFTVVATGDVLVHQDRSLTEGAARAGGPGDYDFSGVLAPVAPVIGAADLAICHLETPVAPPEGPFRGYPAFVVQPQIVDALAGAGYDVCSTASNHSLDDGLDGLVRTLDTLDAAGVAGTGTFRTEQDSRTPRLLDVAGVRVGHIAWTYGLNGIPPPAGREWSVNVFDAERADVTGMLEDAARARRAGAEVVIASLHCCAEYDHEPSAAQVAVAEALAASPDVDLVLGHHAHVVQPIELVDGTWVAYGLGNHIAQHSTRGYATEDSVIARFTFTRDDDGRVGVTLAEAVPTRIDLGAGGVRVVPTGAGSTPADAQARDRVVEVLLRRGAADDGLVVAPR
jgi:poly-gamma-glutamate capsule biosynthesis protein CapA/YwtB (metallophosphatase superfamily)